MTLNKINQKALVTLTYHQCLA